MTTQYQDAEGLFHTHEKVVFVKLANGSERDVLEVMINVMNFWQTFLHSIGAISKPRNYSIPVIAQPRSRAEAGDSRLDFELVKGLRFRQSIRLQKYNYVTGKIELMDLKGGQLKFNLYMPNAELDLTLKNELLRKEFRKKIALTEKESIEFGLLKTDREKQAYLEKLSSAQQVVRELAAEAGLSKDAPGKG